MTHGDGADAGVSVVKCTELQNVLGFFLWGAIKEKCRYIFMLF